VAFFVQKPGPKEGKTQWQDQYRKVTGNT
jgi:hypothetical protein